MYYFNTTCSPGYYRNDFIATVALGYTHVQLSPSRYGWTQTI